MANKSDEQSFFSCTPCKKKFLFRRALDSHNKRLHKNKDPNEEEQNNEVEQEPEHSPVAKRRKIDMNNLVEEFSKVDTTKEIATSILPVGTSEVVEREIEIDELSQISEISDESHLSLPELEKPDDSE